MESTCISYWPHEKEGEQRSCRTEICDHSWVPRSTNRVKPDVKKKKTKTKSPRITRGLGRKDTKGEAEVCAKQLGAEELMVQSTSCSWSRVCSAAHQVAPACALQHRGPGDQGTYSETEWWRGIEWTNSRLQERYMASSQEKQKQLSCSTADLRLPFSHQCKETFPLYFLSCFGDSHLTSPSFFPSQWWGKRVWQVCVCVCVGRGTSKIGQLGGDHSGSCNSTEILHGLGKVVVTKGIHAIAGCCLRGYP